jgi:cyclophilin family peptidyl-prolyl cis-trans isomerase
MGAAGGTFSGLASPYGKLRYLYNNIFNSIHKVTMFKPTLFAALLFFTQPLWPASAPIVDLQTNFGTITLQLNPDKAPITTDNFLTYVNEGFYTNTIFHRVIPKFMIQGGGFSAAGVQKATHTPIVLESTNGLSNLRGSIAMARTNVDNSATAQFFINTVDNLFLDHSSSTAGYAVFGNVIENTMTVADKISANPTNTNDQPIKTVIIEAARPRYAQLQFADLNSDYTAGEKLTLLIQENQQVREQALDLWVAIQLNNQLFFVSPENSSILSLNPKPFQRKMPTSLTSHKIFSLTLPPGLAGHYQLFAIFNDPGKDVSDIAHTMRSNLAQAAVTIH